MRPTASVAKWPGAEKDMPRIRCHLRWLIIHRVFLQNKSPVGPEDQTGKRLAWKDRLAILIPCPSPRRTEQKDQEGRPDFTNFPAGADRGLCYSCGAVLDWSRD